MEKMTRKESFVALKGIVAEATVESEMKDFLVDFLDKQVELLDKKSEKAKERADKKKAEGDELMEVVFDSLDEKEFKTLDEVFAVFVSKLGVEIKEEMTKPKLVAKLTKLVKAGRVEKEKIKVEGRSGKSMAYKAIALAAAPDPFSEDTK